MENQKQEIEYRDPRTLKPHPDNPRGVIHETSSEIAELAADIKTKGIIQPLVILPDDRVLAGHRRRMAAIVAGLETVPVIVRPLKNGEFAEEFFLSENINRQDLSPLEEARAIGATFRKMKKASRKGIYLTDLCRRLNMEASTVRQRLAILELPESVQQQFHRLELPMMAAKTLERLLKWPEEIVKMANLLALRSITLKDLDKIVTDRMHDLLGVKDPEPEPEKPRHTKQWVHSPEASASTLTREIVMKNLTEKTKRSISLFNVKVVFDATCCNCGLMNSKDVCLACPLPKFVNGLVGRASGGDDA